MSKREQQPLPPQNLEAESSVLGAVLRENEVLLQVRELLLPGDFYRSAHQEIFAAMGRLSDANEPIDLVTLSDALGKKLKGAGGSAYLAELGDYVPSVANVMTYARRVLECSRLRGVLVAAQRAMTEVYEGSDDAETIAARLSSAVSVPRHEDRAEHIADVMKQALKNIERVGSSNGLIGVPTGLGALDVATGGIPRGELWILAGRPSMGKTALAVAVSKGAAQRGHGVAFVTIESHATSLVIRMLSEATGIENRNLRRARLADSDYPLIAKAAGQIGTLPFWFKDGERSWDRIKLWIRAKKLKNPEIDLVVIDYIGLLSVAGAEKRYLELGIVSADASTLAKQLNVGIVLLSQLNRAVEKQQDKMPHMSDLRESGNLEQDADVIGLLFRPYYYDDTADESLAELDIAKCREGDTGAINLRFNRYLTSFSDWERSDNE